MDMLVTTPKSEIETSRKEGKVVEREGGYWFRTFRFRPKVGKGNRIFFVENGLIRGYGIVFGIHQTKGRKLCDLTKRAWGKAGDWVVAYSDWHWLKNPIEFKGFQGIRYVNRMPGLEKEIEAGARW